MSTKTEVLTWKSENCNAVLGFYVKSLECKGRTAGPRSHYSQSGISFFKKSRAIPALGGFQPLIRPSANPEHMSGRYPMDPGSSRVDVVDSEFVNFLSSFLFLFTACCECERICNLLQCHLLACDLNVESAQSLI